MVVSSCWRTPARFLPGLIVLLLTGVALEARAEATPSGAVKLLRITPSGDDVPTARQIVLQFDRPMVPLGRAERSADELPIRVQPDPGCEWRWLDPSALACQLGDDHPLARATRYRVAVGAGIAAMDGTRLAEPVRHSFVTERPDVRYQYFQTWTGPGEPVAWLTFNQEVRAESLQRHVFFRLADGRRRAVRAERDANRSRTFFVRPRSALPLDQVVNLAVEAGIESEEGPLPGVAGRMLATFRTFPELRFLGLECFDNSNSRLALEPGASSAARCNPMQRVMLVFSSPVRGVDLGEGLEVAPDLAGGRTDFDPWAGADDYSRLGQAPSVARLHRYPVALPVLLKAFERYELRAAAGSIHDEFGRSLPADLFFAFQTDHRPPNLHMGHANSVLESQVDTHVPVVVTNLDELRARFSQITTDGVEARDLTVPVDQAEDVAFRMPLPVRDWLGGRPGAVLGEITSPERLPGSNYWFYSLVTPYQVHVKVGHYNSLVWVTDMATGEPVKGAKVTFFADDFLKFHERFEPLTEGETDGDGLARLAGQSEFDPEGGILRSWQRPEDDQLFVRVEKDGDFALVPLTYDFRLQQLGPNGAWISTDNLPRFGHLKAWGATAQGVYRAGQTIEFKLWVRDEGNRKLRLPPEDGYALRVHDPTGKTVHEVESLELNEYGAYAGEFSVPESGAVGWYSFVLEPSFARTVLTPLSVLVTDFTPAPFQVETELQAGLFRTGDTVAVDSRARLHAGGPYRDADSRVVARLRPTILVPEDPAARGFRFHDDLGQGPQLIHRSNAALDGAGDRRTEFTLPESAILYGSLEVESAVRDDRGKYVSGRSQARYAGRDRYVGLLQSDWVLETGEPAVIRAVVVDENGRIAPGTKIAITIERQITKAARVKEAGNAYVKRFTHEWKEESTCEVVSASEPVECTFTPQGPGSHRMTARILDTRERESTVSLSRWATGAGQILWEEPPGNHIDVVAENDSLKVGDTARYLVRNPFPGAKALVTVERYGVIESWVETFDESSEIIEFEVVPDMIPGFYLSVVLTSPRVERPGPDILDEGGVDLGKPALRIGYAQTEVRDPYKELAIEVRPERDRYKPREKVVVDLRARTRDSRWPDAEVAVTVLDESVLALLAGGRGAYDPYRGFHHLEGLDLWNFNLLKQLIGVQRFEKKGASPGGDGALAAAMARADATDEAEMRSRFAFVAYWNPSVRLNRFGRARIEFEVPDNLTGWRVLVFGATRGEHVGSGEARFVVNRPTELRPALPNQVLEGDRFKARFTVMNRTDDPRQLDVRLRASGDVVGEPAMRDRIEARPYERQRVELDVEAARPGEIAFAARAGDAKDADGLEVSIPVGTRAALDVMATYGSLTEGEVSVPIEFPADLRPDTSRVSVVASPSALGNLDGAFAYMRNYPYACWEQKLSKSVMAAHFQALRPWLGDEFGWPGSKELPSDALARAANYQAPNGGMAYWIPRDDYVSPYLSAYTALAFHWLRAEGYEIPAPVEERLHGYLETLLRRDTFPSFYSRGMASSVRAVALAALAPTGRLEAKDLERYRPHVAYMDLFGKAWYLSAVARVGGHAEIEAEVRDALLSHAIQSGGKLVFSETFDDGAARMHSSELRSQCSILSAFSAIGAEGRAALGEVAPNLARSITQSRGQRDHWENTQENLFCTHALIDYARAYEAESPDFEARVTLDDRPLGEARFSDRRAAPIELSRPVTARDPGRTEDLKVAHAGVGRLYYAARVFFSRSRLPDRAANAGIDVRREYNVERDGRWIRLEDPYTLRAGELVRVDLFVSLPTARNFVVVDDPVPGGLEPVNRQLATASTVDADEEVFAFPPDSFYFEYDDWLSFNWTRWSFYHRELRHDSARFYSDYLPAGRYHLSYVAQAIADGEFTILPLRAEEMYDPDVYGRGVPAVLRIGGEAQ